MPLSQDYSEFNGFGFPGFDGSDTSGTPASMGSLVKGLTEPIANVGPASIDGLGLAQRQSVLSGVLLAR